MTKVAQILKTLGLTQSELARFLNVAPSTVNRWERNVVKPKGIAASVINILYLVTKRIEHSKESKFKNYATSVFGDAIRAMTVEECIRKGLPSYVFAAENLDCWEKNG